MAVEVMQSQGPDALSRHGQAFDQLADQAGAPVTARRRWLQAWIDAHHDWTPWLLTANGGQGLVGALPLAFRKRGPLLDVVMLGHGPSDDARLLSTSSTGAAELANALRSHLAAFRWWRVRLHQLPAEDPVVQALARSLPINETQADDGMPLVEMAGISTQPVLSRNTRKALAKIRNRLKGRGLEPRYEWITDPEHIGRTLPEMMRVRRERDQALGRRPDHDDPVAAAFYREVIMRHAAADEVALLTLRLDGDLAAYLCAFRDGRTLRSWDNRLSPRWADLSAGRLVNTTALEFVAASPDYDALDWMRGLEPYKLQSATQVVPTEHFYAWSSPLLRRIDSLVAGFDRDVRAFIKSRPRLDKSVDRLRDLVLELVRRVRVRAR